MPEFEWDTLKNLRNLLKHGAWLSEAAHLWDKGAGLKYARARAHHAETRYHAFGVYQGKIWQAVFALRAGRVRLISFHRASRKGRAAYLRR